MSRLAKKPILIPDGVFVEFVGDELRVKGQKGELSRKVPASVHFEISGHEIYVKVENELKNASALSGTFIRHVANMIQGVSSGFEKHLELHGIGFKAEVETDTLVLNLGFSHPIKVKFPEGVEVVVEKNKIIVSGIDKEKVGNFAATIRSFKVPEPYKGKGIRYSGEIVRRKSGKKIAAA